MALDIEKLKKTAQELQAKMARGNGPSLRFWRPKDGKNTIRILPPWTDEGILAGQFHREVHQHWNVSENAGPVLCPKKTLGASQDKECPICDLVDQLRERKNDVKAQELVKDLRAKVAYLLSVVDMSDPEYTVKDVAEWKKERPDSPCPFEVGDPKIQCFAAGSTVAEQIINVVVTNEMDITDLAAGHNIFLTKIPNKDRMKTRYTVTADLKKTKSNVAEGAVLPDLSKVGKVPSYDDMLKLLGEGPASSFLTALPATASSPDDDLPPSWAGSDDADDLQAEMQRGLKG